MILEFLLTSVLNTQIHVKTYARSFQTKLTRISIVLFLWVTVIKGLKPRSGNREEWKVFYKAERVLVRTHKN